MNSSIDRRSLSLDGGLCARSRSIVDMHGVGVCQQVCLRPALWHSPPYSTAHTNTTHHPGLVGRRRPQMNTLWPSLSGHEHLRLYATIKGGTRGTIEVTPPC